MSRWQASAFVAQGPMPLRASRAAAPVAQFGTGNTDNNGFDEKGNANFIFSPITGGSKVRLPTHPSKAHGMLMLCMLLSQEYPYGQFETDQSGELPAKLLALLIVVGLPASFAVGIWTAAV